MAAIIFMPATILGAPLSSWRIYEAGTTTLADVFTAEDLNDALENPVDGDADGVFPSIWLDDTQGYRAQYLVDGAVVSDYDPYNVADAGTVDGDDVDLSLANITDALGYVPVNKAGDTATALFVAHTVATAANGAGYLGAIHNDQPAAYTVLATDAGKLIRHNSSSPHTHSIAANLLGDGNMVGFRNVGTGVLTISASGGGSIKALGSGTAQSWALAQHGEAWVRQDSSTVFYISGLGLS
jgi:hypothetical protein